MALNRPIQVIEENRSAVSKNSDVSHYTAAISRQHYLLNNLKHVQIQLKLLTNDVDTERNNFILLDQIKKILQKPRTNCPHGIELEFEEMPSEIVNCDIKKFKMAVNILIQFASVYSPGQVLKLKSKHDRMVKNRPSCCLVKISFEVDFNKDAYNTELMQIMSSKPDT